MLVLTFPTWAVALGPDELVLVTNGNVPASTQCAEFYAKSRGVPAGRICALKVPASEEISFEQYEREVVPGIRSFIRRNNLTDKVHCLVNFYGMPIRIGPHKMTPAEKQEMV